MMLDKNPNFEESRKRMEQFGKEMDKQIFMCSNENELVELASVLTVTAMKIYKITMGEEVAKQFIRESLQIEF